MVRLQFIYIAQLGGGMVRQFQQTNESQKRNRKQSHLTNIVLGFYIE